MTVLVVLLLALLPKLPPLPGEPVAASPAWQVSFLLACPTPAPRYRVDTSVDLRHWEQAAVTTNSFAIVMACERASQQFWRIVPLQNP